MQEMLRHYSADVESLARFYPLSWSVRRRESMARTLRLWLDRFHGLDWGALSLDAKVDAVLLRNDAERRLDALEFQAKRQQELAELVPFGPTIAAWEDRRYAVEPPDAPETAERLNEIAAQAKSLKEAIEAELDGKEGGKAVAKPLALRASKAVKELREALETWFKQLDGYKPVFSWWARQPYETASKALTEYETVLREQAAGQKGELSDPLVGDPVGEARILQDLQYEMIPYTPEELIAIGERDMAWCEAECQKAADEMGVANWSEALERVRNIATPPGEMNGVIRQQALEAIEFVDSHELVTADELCRETWRVDMMDPKFRRQSPFALYGGQKILVSNPSEEMAHDQKRMMARANSVHLNRATTHHELIPGHHLQLFMSERCATQRLPFMTPFHVEGWALHWELIFWDLGFARCPEDKVGMLFWRLHRGARILVSLRYHLGQMSPEEMVDVLVNRVGHERDSAVGEVRRYIGEDYPPLYQIAYLIGALQLMALRSEVVGTGRMTEREFHDAVLAQNGIPFALVRAKLLGLPIEPGFNGGWRFADA